MQRSYHFMFEILPLMKPLLFRRPYRDDDLRAALSVRNAQQSEV